MAFAVRQGRLAACLALLGLGAMCFSLLAPAAAQDAPPVTAVASDWIAGHKSRTRLTAGAVANQHYAFVEIELAEGWKTYWRSPGDSGIPPRFEFGKSKNLASATVLYPAPKRITDKGETIVGYTGTVILPVLLSAADPAKPIELAADVQFGMCKDICVPTEAALTLSIPADAATELSGEALASLARVPHTSADLAPSDPRLDAVATGAKTGPKKLSLSVAFPAGTAGADAFLEGPGGLYLPLLAKTSEDGTRVTFEADLSKDVDLAALTGKSIAVTLVSDAGATETSFKFE